jgi:hypothetical protein
MMTIALMGNLDPLFDWNLGNGHGDSCREMIPQRGLRCCIVTSGTSVRKTIQDDEEFFMIRSWTDHVRGLQWHQRLRTP